MRVLVKAIAGSHLFGTNTPSSDTDYKGVYLPTRKDLLLGNVQQSISIKTNESGNKNTKDDVDVEFYSLKKFMEMLFEGQTVALELLWTPDTHIIEADPLWYQLRRHRGELLHKKVTAFVHYCKTQADKYGVKGSRMAAVKRAIEVLEALDINQKLEAYWDVLKINLKDVEHINFAEQETKFGPIPYMEVCERMHQDNQKVKYALEGLNKLYASYGHRAKAAEDNNGIDWKALSHAYRVCCQAIDILENKRLTLPLAIRDLEMVRDVKQGKIPFNEFRPILEDKLTHVLEAQKVSTLNEEFNRVKWCEDYVMEVYSDIVNG